MRVWVMHDAAVEWCADPAQLERGFRAWLTAGAAGRMALG